MTVGCSPFRLKAISLGVREANGLAFRSVVFFALDGKRSRTRCIDLKEEDHFSTVCLSQRAKPVSDLTRALGRRDLAGRESWTVQVWIFAASYSVKQLSSGHR